jgi:ATP-binding cassette subfamily E protein 1
MVRVAVIDRDKCKPEDCKFICLRFCPKVKSRIEAIKIDEELGKPIIIEKLCSGCGICIKKCPFNVIRIINIPEEIEPECSHRYGKNTFKLFRLPTPNSGMITGLIGENGAGKSTALRIISGEIKPNLGDYDSPPDWRDIQKHYRGTILQSYFEKVASGKIKISYKPQYIDKIPRILSGKVIEVLENIDERDILEKILLDLELKKIIERPLTALSGGELQRVAIAAALIRDVDIYIFDEPSSHLDISQRIKISKIIRTLPDEGKTVLVAEHDLAMLDYLSDQVAVLYGVPGVYGIVSHSHGVRVGINVYLNGFIPDENMRFRNESIKFHIRPPRESEGSSNKGRIFWPCMKKNFGDFNLEVDEAYIDKGEIIGILGPNGIGKTTFIKLLVGIEKPDNQSKSPFIDLSLSYKPQYIYTEYQGTVLSLLKDAIGERKNSDFIENAILRPLKLNKFLDRDVSSLSGGELQRVAIATCLAKDAKIFFLDEPSAYLDVEERLAVAKALRKIVEDKEAYAFIVEHDIAIQDFMADRLSVFSGEPGKNGVSEKPQNLREGMNKFLACMEITFRRDRDTGRPRVNKIGSKLDREQKGLGEYYYIPRG